MQRGKSIRRKRDAVRLREIAERLGCRLEGEGGVEILAVRSLEEAGAQDLTFVAHERYVPRLGRSAAAAVILGAGLPSVRLPALRTPNPVLAFARALTLFHPPAAPPPGIHPSAVIAPDVRVNPGASIGPLCVLGSGVEVGAGTVLEAHMS